MNYNKWLKFTFFTSFIFYLVLFVFYCLVDPRQVFNNSITKYKFEYSRYYSKHQYETLKSGEYSLIFGTSRSQKLSSESLGMNILNFHNLYGEPGDILNFLNSLDKNQIKNIVKIYYLVSLDTMRDESEFLNYQKSNFLDKLKEVFPLTNLDLKYLFKDVYYNLFQNKIYYYLNKDGSQFVFEKNQSTILNEKIKQQNNPHLKTSNSIDTLLSLNNFCKEKGIDIIYYTPTFSDKFILNFTEIEYLWSKLLNGGIKGFYFTYYIEGVSNKMNDNKYIYFTDTTHLNHNMMNKIFKEIIVGSNQKYYVNNIFSLKNKLDKSREF